MEFNSSPRSTVGVEVEYGIIDRTTGALVPRANDLLAWVGADHPGGEHPKAKNELFQCSLEVITGICETPAQAKADIAATLMEVKPWLDAENLGLESTGTHPFGNWRGMPMTPRKRYLAMVDQIRWPAYRLLIHGVHVHVGVRSGEKAVATTNALTSYLPLLVALSASSPYWHGTDTGMASCRTKIFEGMPTTGIPPRLKDWAEYLRAIDTLLRAKSIESIRSVWWDVRPHPDFGTVELRMCDGIPTLDETMTVAAIAQSLVTTFDRMIDAGEPLPLHPDWMVRDNKWRASRWGLDAELVIDNHGNTHPIRELIAEMVDDLGPIAAELGCLDELTNAERIMDTGACYQRQRERVAAGASMVELALSLVAEHDESLALATQPSADGEAPVAGRTHDDQDAASHDRS